MIHHNDANPFLEQRLEANLLSRYNYAISESGRIGESMVCRMVNPCRDNTAINNDNSFIASGTEALIFFLSIAVPEL